MTSTYAGRSAVQISAEARELSVLQNIQASSSAQSASNSMKTRAFSGSKVASAGGLTTHNCLEPILKISGAIPPQNLSPPWHIMVQLYFTVNKNPTDATVCRYLFTAKLLYMFWASQHPSSGVLKTVPAACVPIRPRWRGVAVQVV